MPPPTSIPPAQSASRRQQNHHHPLTIYSQQHHRRPPPPPPSSSSEAQPPSNLPLTFRLPFRTNTASSAASLAPSVVAEGRPIPVDGSTAEHRTEALRELNSHYPSPRHRYDAKSAGTQSTTYSEPVIVRSYYRPPTTPHNGARSTSRGGGGSVSGGIVVVRSGGTAAPGSVSGSVASRTRPYALAGKMASAGSGMLSIMARARGIHTQQQALTRPLPEDAHLPPLEAFTFKSFLENLEREETAAAGDINADLDRIAEICARSRYSLSNQYEVHYGPHGADPSFAAAGTHPHEGHQGPTLQAVTSDDDAAKTTERKRRRLGGRRDSRAMGTLETIMSSSRSSDEDKGRATKKSAAEIAEEVRGRASARNSQRSSPAGSTGSGGGGSGGRTSGETQRPGVKRTLSSSLALIDATKASAPASSTGDAPSAHRASVVSLVGEPALPQPCTSQLEVHTSSSTSDVHITTTTTAVSTHHHQPADTSTSTSDSNNHSKPGNNPCPCPMAKGAVSSVDDATATGFLSTLAGWIPWGSSEPTTSSAPAQRGRAAGSLRSLLKTVNETQGL